MILAAALGLIGYALVASEAHLIEPGRASPGGGRNCLHGDSPPRIPLLKGIRLFLVVA